MSETDETSQDEVVAGLSNEAKKKVDDRIAQYIECREVISAKKAAFEESIKPLVDLQNMLTGWLQQFMQQSGAQSIKSKMGTCYCSTKYTASLADPDAFMKYVISNQNFDLLDRKANVTAVKDHVKEKGVLPPGVNLSALETIGVRRPTAKA